MSPLQSDFCFPFSGKKDKWTGILDVSLVSKKWISLHQFQQRQTFSSSHNLFHVFCIFSFLKYYSHQTDWWISKAEEETWTLLAEQGHILQQSQWWTKTNGASLILTFIFCKRESALQSRVGSRTLGQPGHRTSSKCDYDGWQGWKR